MNVKEEWFSLTPAVVSMERVFTKELFNEDLWNHNQNLLAFSFHRKEYACVAKHPYIDSNEPLKDASGVTLLYLL